MWRSSVRGRGGGEMLSVVVLLPLVLAMSSRHSGVISHLLILLVLRLAALEEAEAEKCKEPQGACANSSADTCFGACAQAVGAIRRYTTRGLVRVTRCGSSAQVVGRYARCQRNCTSRGR